MFRTQTVIGWSYWNVHPLLKALTKHDMLPIRCSLTLEYSVACAQPKVARKE